MRRRATRLGFLLILPIVMAHAAAFDLQGHRGARGLAPENTLGAFARALAIGVTTLELDCGVTRDGVVVVSHNRALDPTITRGPDGEWLAEHPLIHTLDVAALARFDVGRIRPGTDYARRFSAQQGIDGARIPRLAEVFELARRAGNRSVRFNIETKIDPTRPEDTVGPEAFARGVIALAREHGVAHRTTIQSFDWRTLQIVQAEAPEIATVYLTIQQSGEDNVRAGADGSPWTAGMRYRDHGSVPRMVKSAGGPVWSPFHGDLTPALLTEAHQLGLKVIPWTINDRATMDALIDLGVDGIISDYPDRLREAAREKGLALPAPTPVDP
ncbi:MAG: glycerophosphodiester phosphodiesterase [Burkholderiales bacterium]